VRVSVSMLRPGDPDAATVARRGHEDLRLRYLPIRPVKLRVLEVMHTSPGPPPPMGGMPKQSPHVDSWDDRPGIGRWPAVPRAIASRYTA